jgi:hypothetical protein
MFLLLTLHTYLSLRRRPPLPHHFPHNYHHLHQLLLLVALVSCTFPLLPYQPDLDDLVASPYDCMIITYLLLLLLRNTFD